MEGPRVRSVDAILGPSSAWRAAVRDQWKKTAKRTARTARMPLMNIMGRRMPHASSRGVFSVMARRQ